MAWSTVGNIRGPKGDTGPEGPEGPRGPEGPQGEEGPRGPEGRQGIQGEPGEDGEDGAGIDLQQSVDTYDDLPDDLGAGDAGSAFLNRDDGKLYIWDGTAFQPEGEGVEFRGPRGEKGPQGSEGPEGPQGERGPRGETGDQGDKGDTGDTGLRGSRWFRGSGVPSGISNALPHDFYLDTETGAVYEFTD